MEFKKIPGPAPVSQPWVDPNTQMKQSLRIMAKRMLYGARGVLFICGSLLLLTGLVEFFYVPEDPAMHRGYGVVLEERLSLWRYKPDVWFAFMDLGIALLCVLGGFLVTGLPVLFTLGPALLLIGRIFWQAAEAISTSGMPNVVLMLFQFILAGLLFKAFTEARSYRREVQLAREYFRSTAILRQKEARR